MCKSQVKGLRSWRYPNTVNTSATPRNMEQTHNEMNGTVCGFVSIKFFFLPKIVAMMCQRKFRTKYVFIKMLKNKSIN